MILRLDVEYDGAAFYGWAAQPGLRTVESVLTEALRVFWPDIGRPAVAGRTDTGVHASGQVVSVDVSGGPELARVPAALNAQLPRDLAVLAARRAPEGFHARFSARSRRYEYRVLRSRAPSPLRAARTWHWPRELSHELLAACSLLGEHDFRAFTPAETQHRGLPPPGARGRLAAGGRRARVPHRGRLVPAPHGAHARRHDAADGGRRAPARGVRAPARGRRARRRRA